MLSVSRIVEGRRNGEEGETLRDTIEVESGALFRCYVQRRRSLIQDEKLRVSDKGPDEGDSLPLTTAELGSVAVYEYGGTRLELLNEAVEPARLAPSRMSLTTV